jgi:hypothetical protein
VRAKNGAAIYRLAALQMRHELKKDIGYFERTPDMVFALERKTIEEKVKQVPVIKYKSES